MQKILNYINGELVEPANNNYLDNYNPSTGKVYSLIPDSEKEDIDNAVAAAKQAFKEWSKTSKQERSDVLMKIADLVEANFDELVAAESKDNGKPESLAARVDIPRAPADDGSRRERRAEADARDGGGVPSDASTNGGFSGPC